MTTVDNQGNITGNAFVVVVNDRGQHALWQAGISRPAGWRQQSAAMSRQACLDAIAAGSPDMAPARTRGAIMKAGSGSLPLDPSLPPARLARICAEAGPTAILTDRSVKNLSLEGTRVLEIADLAADLGGQPVTAPKVSLDADHLCCVILTSGCTA